MKELERKKGAAGFTLIEMAIVLVVIGLIIGAVLKGQDLISNARSKKFASFVRQAEVAEWAWYDRNGTMAYRTAPLSAIKTFTNSTAIGASIYYVGYVKNGTKNAIVITKGTSLGTVDNWGTDDISYAKSFDAAIDNSADGTKGRVFALGGVSISSAGAVTGISGAAGWDDTAGVKGLIYDFD